MASKKRGAPRPATSKKSGAPRPSSQGRGAATGSKPARGAAPSSQRAPRAGRPRDRSEPRGPRPPKARTPIAGPSRCGTVALVGRPNVGKSTLLNAILGTKIAATTHKPQTTRRQLRGVETRGAAQFVFVDTPGVMKPKHGLDKFMLAEALDAVRDVDVVAFVVGVDARRADQPAADDERALQDVLAQRGARPLVLVVNKVDVVRDRKAILPLLQAWATKHDFQAIVPLSAAKGDNVDELVGVLAGLLPEGEHIFADDALTDAGERDIAGEMIREKCMLELQEELPYRLAVTIEEFDESRRADDKKPLVHVAGVIHVEKASQKAMVIGKGGQRIKAIGQRARQELERLLGCQVMLELLVRVEEDWTGDAKGLRKLGYTAAR